MQITPYSRFVRTIAKLERGRELKVATLALPLDCSDEIFGIYEGDRADDSVYFAKTAFFYFDPTVQVWARQIYNQLIDVYLPDTSSASVTMKLMRVGDLPPISLRFVGVQGKYRDVFEAGRFFMRVIDDIEKNN